MRITFPQDTARHTIATRNRVSSHLIMGEQANALVYPTWSDKSHSGDCHRTSPTIPHLFVAILVAGHPLYVQRKSFSCLFLRFSAEEHKRPSFHQIFAIHAAIRTTQPNTPFCCNGIEGTLCTAGPSTYCSCTGMSSNNPNLPLRSGVPAV